MGLFTINKQNKAYIEDLSNKRAAGQLGLTAGQQDAMVARGQEQVGAATQAAMSQMPATGMDAGAQQRMFQGAVGGMQQALAQQKMGADLASEQRAANQAAELAAQEQAFFQRRKDNRAFITDAAGKAMEIAGTAAMMCWVAVALWGEKDERTLNARLWCVTHDNAFTRAYQRHGQTWARWVERSLVARAVAWPIWTGLSLLGRRTFAEVCIARSNTIAQSIAAHERSQVTHG